MSLCFLFAALWLLCKKPHIQTFWFLWNIWCMHTALAQNRVIKACFGALSWRQRQVHSPQKESAGPSSTTFHSLHVSAARAAAAGVAQRPSSAAWESQCLSTSAQQDLRAPWKQNCLSLKNPGEMWTSLSSTLQRLVPPDPVSSLWCNAGVQISADNPT